MKKEEIKERLLERIEIDNKTGCWNWKLSLDEWGYGRTKLYKTRQNWKAHRLSYTVFKGDINGGLFVCHKCDNPKCINPEHLFLGTHQDNMNDMVKKGRANKNSNRCGNNNAGIKIMANYKIYKSYSEAARDIGISNNEIKKRIGTGKPGYKKFT